MKSHGFTLIELMIVVAIIGILAATAVPLYHAYIDEAARSEARTTLADLASKEEAYFSSWGHYIETETAGTYPNSDGASSAHVRSIQTSEDTNWNSLGIESGTGGLWDGPVYFRYRVATDPNNENYRACAHRWTSNTTQEMFSLSNSNRRAIVERSAAACQINY